MIRLTIILLLLSLTSSSQPNSYKTKVIGKDTIYLYPEIYLKVFNDSSDVITTYRRQNEKMNFYIKEVINDSTYREYFKNCDDSWEMLETFKDGELKAQGTLTVSDSIIKIDTLWFTDPLTLEDTDFVRGYLKLVRNGMWTEFTQDKHKLKAVGKYVDDKKDGEWKVSICTFNWELQGEHIERYKDGKLITTSEN